MAEEASVFGRQNRLDEVIGQLVEGNGVVVLDAAPADLDAEAIDKSHREILTAQPFIVARKAHCWLRQRQHKNEARKAERRRLAEQFDNNPGGAIDVETLGEGGNRLIACRRALLARK